MARALWSAFLASGRIVLAMICACSLGRPVAGFGEDVDEIHCPLGLTS